MEQKLPNLQIANEQLKTEVEDLSAQLFTKDEELKYMSQQIKEQQDTITALQRNKNNYAVHRHLSAAAMQQSLGYMT